MSTYSVREPKKAKKRFLPLFFALFIIVTASVVYVLSSRDKKVQEPVLQQESSSVAVEETKVEPREVAFDEVALQKLLSDWERAHSGQYSVVLADKAGKTLASINPDEVYYAASIYKLFVVYEAYQRVDSGVYNLEDTYAAGLSLRDCLDQIVRLSNTNEAQICAETLWAEQGKEEQTARLKQLYGLKNTSLTSITTSAADTAVILARIESGEGLSESSRSLFMESMKRQIHRKGLPAGITRSTVYEKVGFNEAKEYHDAAILHLPDGRSLIVSIFTNGAGVKNIAALGTELETSILKH